MRAISAFVPHAPGSSEPPTNSSLPAPPRRPQSPATPEPRRCHKQRVDRMERRQVVSANRAVALPCSLAAKHSTPPTGFFFRVQFPCNGSTRAKFQQPLRKGRTYKPRSGLGQTDEPWRRAVTSPQRNHRARRHRPTELVQVLVHRNTSAPTGTHRPTGEPGGKGPVGVQGDVRGSKS